MGHDPSMPFYCNDYLSSPKIRCLSLELRGAFIELISYCWASQSASLPSDDDDLMAISCLGEKWLSDASLKLRRLFIPHPTIAGCLTNQKVYDLWLERVQFRKKKSEAGKKGNSVRWPKEMPKKRRVKSQGDTTAITNGSHSDTFANHKLVTNDRSSSSE